MIWEQTVKGVGKVGGFPVAESNEFRVLRTDGFSKSEAIEIPISPSIGSLECYLVNR